MGHLLYALDVDAFWQRAANIFADGASVLTPVGIPVWPVTSTFPALTATLLATSGKLLTIGDFSVHEMPFGQGENNVKLQKSFVCRY